MYALCKATKWTHLPVAGGWYDQHPAFVDKVVFIMGMENAYERQKQEEEKKKQARSGSGQRQSNRYSRSRRR